MSDNPHPKSPVEIVPSVQDGISALGSAHAPFVYFENASAFGHLNGVIQITLEAQRFFPSAPPAMAAVSDCVVTAHLRMNIPAAKGLKAAIEGALLLAAPAPQAKN